MLEIKNLWIETEDFPILRNIELKAERGKLKIILGESGGGKSTLGLFIGGILKENTRARGSLFLDGKEYFPPDEKSWRGKKAGIVFQDPYSFFDPRKKILSSIKEVLKYHLFLRGNESEKRALFWLNKVNFPEKFYNYFPYQLSGGMLQRAAIASVSCLEPEIIIADEPTSALDPPLRKGISKLLKKISRDRYVIYITHFAEEALELGEDFLVLYSGYVMEETEGKFFHPYSKLLLGSIVKRGKKLKPAKGFSPHPSQLPEGCPFRERCQLENERCRELPPLRKINSSKLRCWNVS